MAIKNTEAERRSQVAEACLDFGSQLLRLRVSSVTPADAQGVVKKLFDWFTSHDGFSEANAGIAIHSISFGEKLLESRKTTTVDEAVETIQKLYLDLWN